ncbi:MAG: iron-containing alcohol dehydrogenase [Woeseiaceae bacterium]|nr:iron-containing alcohol dehydrogenase [Woeseiaceae bacterium]
MILYYKLRAFVVTWLLRLLPRQAPIVFKGPDSMLTLSEQAAVLGFKKVIIVTDGFLAQSGLLDGMQQALQQHGVDYVIYDGVRPNPSFDQVVEAEALLAREGCEAVIAVGGGSVLDAAKMAALLHTNPGPLRKFDGIQKAKNPPLPILAVPSTAGTGAEVTLAAVITDPDTHRKIPVVDTKLIPGYIALDPNLMKGLPPGITASTGMDALTHAVESYLATSSVASTEVQAKAAIRLIFSYLLRAYRDGEDVEAREAMALAAFYAGAAFDRTSVGYVHGVAHQLGRVCDTPHGTANAMVLPEVLAAYGDSVHGRLAELAKVAGTAGPGESVQQQANGFIEAIRRLRMEMDMPLKPEKLDRQAIPEMVTETIKETGALYPVPRYFHRSEITGLFEALLAE